MYGGVTPPPSSLLLSLLLFSQSIFFGVCAIDNSSQSLRPRPRTSAVHSRLPLGLRLLLSFVHPHPMVKMQLLQVLRPLTSLDLLTVPWMGRSTDGRRVFRRRWPKKVATVLSLPLSVTQRSKKQMTRGARWSRSSD